MASRTSPAQTACRSRACTIESVLRSSTSASGDAPDGPRVAHRRRRRSARRHAPDQGRHVVGGPVRGAIELVGTTTLRDTVRATRVHGTVCFTGMLSGAWTVPDFYPIDYLPSGVRLTAYSGEATDLPPSVLQAFMDAVAQGRASVPIHAVYSLADLPEAHAIMESGGAAGQARRGERLTPLRSGPRQSARGRVSVKVAPWPGPGEAALRSPPCARASWRAMVSPMPDPRSVPTLRRPGTR